MRMGPKKKITHDGDNFTFTHAQTRPLWTDGPQHLHVGWGRRRRPNQPCNFFKNPSKSFGAVRPGKTPFPIEIVHRPYNSVGTTVPHCDHARRADHGSWVMGHVGNGSTVWWVTYGSWITKDDPNSISAITLWSIERATFLFCPFLGQMLTNFNSFTATFSGELQKKLEQNLPPHLKCFYFLFLPF